MRRIKLFYLITVISTTTFALSADKQLPTTFSSHHVLFNQTSGVTIFTEKVKMQQGSTSLLADKLTLLNDKHGKVFKAIAEGKPAHYNTLPDKQKKPLDAFGDKIEYYPQKKIVIILGNGLVTQGSNHFTGPYILYNIEKQTVISKPVSKNSRSIIVLQPQDLPGKEKEKDIQ